MIVRTYTHAWNMRVRIYAFDDIRLPMKNGITVPQLVALMITAAVWIPLCLVLGVSSWVGNAGLAVVVFAAVPIVVMLQVDRPIAHEKTIEEWLGSWLQRNREPRRLAALAQSERPRPILLTATRWVPYDASSRAKRAR
jgi:hypothetical protein